MYVGVVVWYVVCCGGGQVVWCVVWRHGDVAVWCVVWCHGGVAVWYVKMMRTTLTNSCFHLGISSLQLGWLFHSQWNNQPRNLKDVWRITGNHRNHLCKYICNYMGALFLIMPTQPELSEDSPTQLPLINRMKIWKSCEISNTAVTFRKPSLTHLNQLISHLFALPKLWQGQSKVKA